MFRVPEFCKAALPALFAAALLGACSHSERFTAAPSAHSDRQTAPAALPQAEPAQMEGALPALAALPGLKDAAAAGFNADVLGDTPLLLSPAGASFSGHTLSLDPQPGETAWAVFEQPGYPADGSLLPASLLHNASAECWLATSQFSRGRWDLLPLSPPDPGGEPGGTASLPIPGGSGLFSPDGTLYLAFLSFGSPVEIDVAELVVEEALPLQAPELLSVSRWDFTDKIELHWERVPKASGYEIYRDTLSAPYRTVGDSAGWIDSAVPDLLGHEYRVAARNSAGRSALSAGIHGYLRPHDLISGPLEWSGVVGNSRNSAGSTMPGPAGEADELKAYPTYGYTSLRDCVAVSEEGRVFVAATSSLLAYDDESGLAWELEIPGMLSCITLGPGGRLYAAYIDYSGGAQSCKLAAISQASGQVLWTYAAFAPIESIHAAADEVCVLLDSYGLLACVNLNGEERWLFGIAGGVSAPALDSDGRIYLYGAGLKSGLPSLLALSPQRERLWEAELPEHQPIGAPLVRESGEILVQVESLPEASGLINASLICFSAQGDWLWDFESAKQDACGLSDGGPGRLRFMTADIDDFVGGPASHGASAVQSPWLYSIGDAGQYQWASPLSSLDSNFFTDSAGHSYFLNGREITVVYENGAALPLLGLDGAPIQGMDLLIPASPYRLLTGAGPYTGSTLDSLKAIGQ